GAVMLNRLKAADRLAESQALTGVSRGQFEHPLRAADHLRATRDQGPIIQCTHDRSRVPDRTKRIGGSRAATVEMQSALAFRAHELEQLGPNSGRASIQNEQGQSFATALADMRERQQPVGDMRVGSEMDAAAKHVPAGARLCDDSASQSL